MFGLLFWVSTISHYIKTMKLYLLNNPALVRKLTWLKPMCSPSKNQSLASGQKTCNLNEHKTWVSDMVTWYWSANTLFWQLSIDHNMDFQYHICTIKPRLQLGFRWNMAAMFHWVGVVGSMCTRSMLLAMFAMKKELYGFLFLCMHVAVSIVMGLWFVTANTELCLKTVTFYHGSKAFRWKLKIFEVSFVPKPWYQI